MQCNYFEPQANIMCKFNKHSTRQMISSIMKQSVALLHPEQQEHPCHCPGQEEPTARPGLNGLFNLPDCCRKTKTIRQLLLDK